MFSLARARAPEALLSPLIFVCMSMTVLLLLSYCLLSLVKAGLLSYARARRIFRRRVPAGAAEILEGGAGN